MKTIDQWQEDSEINDPWNSCPIHRDRIIALIDLIRKKDEAAKICLKNAHPNSDWNPDLLKDAIALTDELS